MQIQVWLLLLLPHHWTTSLDGIPACSELLLPGIIYSFARPLSLDTFPKKANHLLPYSFSIFCTPLCSTVTVSCFTQFSFHSQPPFQASSWFLKQYKVINQSSCLSQDSGLFLNNRPPPNICFFVVIQNRRCFLHHTSVSCVLQVTLSMHTEIRNFPGYLQYIFKTQPFWIRYLMDNWWEGSSVGQDGHCYQQQVLN